MAMHIKENGSFKLKYINPYVIDITKVYISRFLLSIKVHVYGSQYMCSVHT